MSLSPRLHHRIRGLARAPGWRRTALLRRTAAAVLAVLALALALAPRPGGVPVLVAAADLASGAAVGAESLVVREWPAELVPAGALRAPDDAVGRVLVGAARAGEPITDTRLTGAGLTRAGLLGADGAAVPVRLADPDVAALLVAGSRVDVVTLGERADAPVVLAADAEVLTVLPESPQRGGAGGPLVLVAMPRPVAAQVAAAVLSEQVAVTLR